MSRFTLPRAFVPRPSVSRRTAVRSALAVPLLGLALAACSTDDPAAVDDPDAAGDPGAEADATGPASGDGPVTITDPWAKAAEEGMTGVFATITNTTDTDLTLIAASTEAAERVELHQTASEGSGGMSMEEKEGGFPIPAGGELLLEPGGDHIMLMGLTAPLLPGDQVELVLEFEDGTEQPMTATVKDFAGAQESYGGMEEPSDGGGEHE